MRVLEIGPGSKPQAKQLWPDAIVTTMDADPNLKPDIVNDAREMPKRLYNQFDHLLASHVLEHIPWWSTVEALKEWAKVVKPGGSVHVVVPSLEWAAREILSENPSKAVIPHLYAGVTTAWDVHLAGFTMRRLRAVFEAAGLSVTRARSGPYHINILGEVMEAEQHYVCGMRVEGMKQ
ncbi:MAG: methyltransferase domain-containing protein [Chloroflexi bacterium]|nr:methyltransferase domain-containing protein [Chloroflexota bacterium]